MGAIPHAEFNAMRRVTPTQLAEDAYQARTQRALPTITGPAGVPIPDRRSVYRTKIDGPALSAIVRASYDAYVESLTPKRWGDVVAGELVANLRARFPLADMIVLQKYGFAFNLEVIGVELGAVGGYHRMRLAQPLLVPKGQGSFRLPGEGRDAEPTVPTELIGYFDKVVEAARAKSPSFMGAQSFPNQFKAREGRWPTWGDIEAAFPLIGAWMREQRGEGA